MTTFDREETELYQTHSVFRFVHPGTIGTVGRLKAAVYQLH